MWKRIKWIFEYLIIPPLIVLVILTVMIAIQSISYNAREREDDLVWNKGYCLKCGTPFQFVTATDSYHNPNSFYYMCENNHVIKIHRLRGAEN